MDQAIAFLAQEGLKFIFMFKVSSFHRLCISLEGCAQFIEWNPLRTTPVSLPANTYFVIANSLSTANKAATADFNQRVVECRIACKLAFLPSKCQYLVHFNVLLFFE